MKEREEYLRPKSGGKQTVSNTLNNEKYNWAKMTLFKLVKICLFFPFLRSTDYGTNVFYYFGMHLQISQRFGT